MGSVSANADGKTATFSVMCLRRGGCVSASLVRGPEGAGVTRLDPRPWLGHWSAVAGDSARKALQ